MNECTANLYVPSISHTLTFLFYKVWNYETLDLAFIVGLEDEFDTGVASVAFSETSLSGYSLLGAIERGTEGVSYLHVWYGIEKGKPQKIGKEIASQSDQVYCTYWHIK